MPKLINRRKATLNVLIKVSFVWIGTILLLFGLIGLGSVIQPTQRSSTSLLSNFTSQWHDSLFLHLFAMENSRFAELHTDELNQFNWSDQLFEFTTHIHPDDPRSLLGRELPGFYAHNHKLIVASEGTGYADVPIESSPPLDVVLEERDATTGDGDWDYSTEDSSQQKTGDDVVFIYTTHNRESYLPHLDDANHPDDAFHPEVNVTLVSDRLKNSLANKGIGAKVDRTDFTEVLHQNGWEYWQSYEASKPVVQEALAGNSEINYIFDIHRDSRRREDTTTTIDGEDYASLFFVIGSDFQDNEKNIALATTLHEMLEEEYPGLSRGVVQMGGTGRNGVYNQNLSNNAILIEFGGVDNNFTEVYRSADAFAEIFSEYYWDALAVDGNEGEEN